MKSIDRANKELLAGNKVITVLIYSTFVKLQPKGNLTNSKKYPVKRVAKTNDILNAITWRDWNVFDQQYELAE